MLGNVYFWTSGLVFSYFNIPTIVHLHLTLVFSSISLPTATVVLYCRLAFTPVSLSTTCAAVMRLSGSNWSICEIMFLICVSVVLSDGLSIRGPVIFHFSEASIIAFARL